MRARRLLTAGRGGSTIFGPAHFWGFVNGKLGATGPPFQEVYAVESFDSGHSFEVLNGRDPVIPVGAGGSWNDEYVAFPWLLDEGGTYALYASGYDGTQWRTGRYTSATLSASPGAWTADGANPIIGLGALGEPDHEAAYIPRCDYDMVAGITRIWYTGALSDTFSICYAERASDGTVTKYGAIYTGSTGAFPVEIDGDTRLYYQVDNDIGYRTFTDPRTAGTYTDQGVVATWPSPQSLTDGSYDGGGPISFAARPSGGWTVLGTGLQPTGFPSNQREVTTYSESSDGLTFITPIGPTVPMTTDWPEVESMENATVLVVP